MTLRHGIGATLFNHAHSTSLIFRHTILTARNVRHIVPSAFDLTSSSSLPFSSRLYRTKKPKIDDNLPSPPSSPPPLPLNLAALATSQHHSSLTTFLAHATRTKLSPTSTHFVGTRYEYVVAHALAPLGFTLVRVGRSNDAGVDLLGLWTVPSHPLPIRVIVQCKRHARRLGPEWVRALEGAFAGAPKAWQGEGVVGLLVGRSSATKGVREAVARSVCPVGYVMVDDAHEGNGNGNGEDEKTGKAVPGAEEQGLMANEGKVKQFLWNWRAQQIGLEGMGVTLRHKQGAEGGDETDSEIALTWNGWAINRVGDLSTSLGSVAASLDEITEEKVTSTKKKKASKNKADLDPPKKKRGRPKKEKT